MEIVFKCFFVNVIKQNFALSFLGIQIKNTLLKRHIRLWIYLMSSLVFYPFKVPWYSSRVQNLLSEIAWKNLCMSASSSLMLKLKFYVRQTHMLRKKNHQVDFYYSTEIYIVLVIGQLRSLIPRILKLSCKDPCLTFDLLFRKVNWQS